MGVGGEIGSDFPTPPLPAFSQDNNPPLTCFACVAELTWTTVRNTKKSQKKNYMYKVAHKKKARI